MFGKEGDYAHSGVDCLDRAEILEALARRRPAQTQAEQVHQQKLLEQARQIRAVHRLFTARVGERVL